MKLNKILVLLVSVFLTVSCNDAVKKEETVEAPKEVIAFKVTLNVVAQKTDDFCVLYTQDGTLDFKEGVWQEVKGAPNEQSVVFTLPEEVFPTQLRLDLGKNAEQSEVVLKSIKLDYLNNSRTLTGAEIGAFFRADANTCTFDAATGVVKAIEKDGKKQSPSLYPHEKVLAVELPKLAQ